MLKQFSSRPLRLVSRRAALGMLGAAALVRSGPPASAQDVEPIRIVIAFPPGGTSTASMQPLQAPLRARRSARRSSSNIKPGARRQRRRPARHPVEAGRAHAPVRPRRPARHQPPHPGADGVRRAARPLAARHGGGVSDRHLRGGEAQRVRRLSELLALAQRNQLVVGSSGNGSIQHLAAEIFGRVADIQAWCTSRSPAAGRCSRRSSAARSSVLLETGSNIVGAKIALAQPECV